VSSCLALASQGDLRGSCSGLASPVHHYPRRPRGRAWSKTSPFRGLVQGARRPHHERADRWPLPTVLTWPASTSFWHAVESPRICGIEKYLKSTPLDLILQVKL